MATANTVKAITSSNALREMEAYLQDKEYYAYLFFDLILETGIYQNIALSMTVADMSAACKNPLDKYFNPELLSSLLRKNLTDACNDRLGDELFFIDASGIPLTKDRLRTVFNQLTRLFPSYPVTSTALRKTFYWKQFQQTADKPNLIMRRLQLCSFQELADFFGVPLSWIEFETITHKRRRIMTPDYLDNVTNNTLKLITHIKESYEEYSRDDEYYSNLSGFLGALEIIVDKYDSLL